MLSLTICGICAGAASPTPACMAKARPMAAYKAVAAVERFMGLSCWASRQNETDGRRFAAMRVEVTYGAKKLFRCSRAAIRCRESRVTNPQEPISEDAWAALMARAQAGDTADYRRLLVEIAPYLRALAARSMRDRSAIEACVQDGLLIIHTI